ncbi:MAG: hypothetical protein Q7T81_10635 [Pseudolabrys sp.]|nr:hypothetical protein [Pseudolabrys sp.]
MPPKEPRDAPDLEPDNEPDIVGSDVIEDIPPSDALTEDGGNPDHPIHDEDEEDLGPEDYEREIDNANSAV